jgi:tetratricopeptide (TPR) repeat protein
VAKSTEQEIARLMAEGLDHYGLDEIEPAVACWRAVLRLDPRHEVARDYLEVAGFAPEAAAGPVDSGAQRAAELQREALALLDAGAQVEALELLEMATRQAPERLDAQAALDLLRASLYQSFRARTQHGAGVLRVRVGPQEILRFDLPPNAGFVLSMVDGHTSADEIVALTAMDPFEALRMVGKLMDAGIVEVRA